MSSRFVRFHDEYRDKGNDSYYKNNSNGINLSSSSRNYNIDWYEDDIENYTSAEMEVNNAFRDKHSKYHNDYEKQLQPSLHFGGPLPDSTYYNGPLTR